ncbi:MAG: GGDEF domain-containing protein [Pseudomonadota bacterium]
MNLPLPDFLDRPSPAWRCLTAVLVSLPFLLLFLAAHLLAWAIPEIRADLDRTAFALAVGAVLTGVLFELAVIAWLWPRRHSRTPLPRLSLAVTSVVGSVYTVLMVLTGPYSSPMSLVALGVLAVGLLLFEAVPVLKGFVVCSVFVLLYELLRLGGYTDDLPLLAVDETAPLPGWWLFYMRFLFYMGLLVLAGILFALASALARQQLQLEQLSRTDALTGLRNRRHFMERLHEESRRALRTGREYSVVLFDADHFKRINDTWGHHAGDVVLAEIGARLQAGVRGPTDVVARLGGEEFALLLPDTAPVDAARIAARVAGDLRAHRFAGDGGHTFSVTLSAGVAAGNHGEGERVLQMADAALYRAKHEGRDRVVCA